MEFRIEEISILQELNPVGAITRADGHPYECMMDCMNETISADELRQIATALDSLNRCGKLP